MLKIPQTIAFIGAGNMAASIIGGLIANGYNPQNIWASNPSLAKLKDLQKNLDIKITQDNQQAASQADIIVLAVKPQKVHTVIKELNKTLEKSTKLIISLAAGVSTIQLANCLNTDANNIVRCMPNTPALIQSGITGLYAQKTVSQAQKKRAEAIMQAVGAVLWVEKEEQMDILAALSGSGPAYFFKIMEALQTAAERLGLPLEQANMLTLHTALGAAKMAATSTTSLKALREQVTSPGGMTERAIGVLEAAEIDQLFYRALLAGQERAHEISKEQKSL